MVAGCSGSSRGCTGGTRPPYHRVGSDWVGGTDHRSVGNYVKSQYLACPSLLPNVCLCLVLNIERSGHSPPPLLPFPPPERFSILIYLELVIVQEAPKTAASSGVDGSSLPFSQCLAPVIRYGFRDLVRALSCL